MLIANQVVEQLLTNRFVHTFSHNVIDSNLFSDFHVLAPTTFLSFNFLHSVRTPRVLLCVRLCSCAWDALKSLSPFPFYRIFFPFFFHFIRPSLSSECQRSSRTVPLSLSFRSRILLRSNNFQFKFVQCYFLFYLFVVCYNYDYVNEFAIYLHPFDFVPHREHKEKGRNELAECLFARERTNNEIKLFIWPESVVKQSA